eukprot:6075810-Amphidinium_carterae.1
MSRLHPWCSLRATLRGLPCLVGLHCKAVHARESKTQLKRSLELCVVANLMCCGADMLLALIHSALREADEKVKAIEVSASVASAEAVEGVAESVKAGLMKDPLLLYTVNGCMMNGTLRTLLMGGGGDEVQTRKKAVEKKLRASCRKWKDVPQFVAAAFFKMVAPAVTEKWEAWEFDELSHVQVLCHALAVTADTELEVSKFPALQVVDTFLRVCSWRYTQVGE